jgi:hypothetical protein
MHVAGRARCQPDTDLFGGGATQDGTGEHQR